MRYRLLLLLCSACGPTMSTTDTGILDADPRDASDAALPCTADTTNDVNNCGRCGHPCPHLGGAVPSCIAGSCSYECIGGFADCNRDLEANASDGCEVTLANDAAHCGRCGNECLGGGATHSTGSCESSACVIGCEQGWDDCNSDLSDATTDGCESELAVDADHCGSCSNLCDSECSAGLCEGTVPACSLFADYIERPTRVRLAAGGGGFLLSWIEFHQRRLLALRLDPDGHPRGSVTILADGFAPGWHFDIGWNGANYVVAWQSFEGRVAKTLEVSPEGLVGTESMLPPTPESSSFYPAVRVTSGDGGVVVTVNDTALWLEGSSLTQHDFHDDFDPHLAPVANGFVALGRRRLPPTAAEPDGTLMLEHLGLSETLVPTGGPNDILRTSGLVSLTSFGNGALGVSSANDRLLTIVFDEFGTPGTPQTTSPLVRSSFDLATYDEEAWLASTFASASSFSSDRPVGVMRAGPDGSFAAPTLVADTRRGFMGTPHVAANEQGALVVWRWSGFGVHRPQAIESVFIRRDGSVLPCE